MSTEPARWLCLQQAAELLRGMTGTRPWGGSYPHAPTVEVGEDRQFEDVGTYPWIGLLPAPGSMIERDLHDGSATDSFRVLMYGYVQGDGTVSRTQWLLRIVGDSQVTLYDALTGAFAVARPGTALAYADDLTFEDEDLIYRRSDTGAEWLVPLVFRIPDVLTT